MTFALICAGQGGQHQAMFDAVAPEPAAQPVLRSVSDRLGVDVTSGTGWAQSLNLSDNCTAQILVVGHALAVSSVLSAHGIFPTVFAGYSVGELAAHACAGAISPEAAFDLALARAACMDQARASSGDPQGMAGIIGLRPATVSRIADEVGVAIAIVNGPSHTVVGGPVRLLPAMEAAASSAGAQHVRRLDVEVASHTRFIAQAGPCFAEALSRIGWKPPAVPVLSGLDGAVIRSVDDAVRVLSTTLHTTLDWHSCLTAAMEYGARVVVQVGPGRALARIVEEGFPDVQVRAADEFRTVAGLVRWLERRL